VDGELLGRFLTLFFGALTLNRDVFLAARDAPGALPAALLIAFVAGCSSTLGRCVVLFANRVSRDRFMVAVLMAASVYVVRLVVWCVSIWLIARLLFGLVPFETALLIILLGQAPQVFAFLVMSPYIGSSVRRVLDVYSLIVVVAAARVMLDARVSRTLLCVGAGWVVVVLLSDLLERPLSGVRTWMWRASSGQPAPATEEAIRRQLLVDRG
jgi:hypothetical protein